MGYGLCSWVFFMVNLGFFWGKVWLILCTCSNAFTTRKRSWSMFSLCGWTSDRLRSCTVDGNPKANHHRKDGAKTRQIMGNFTNLNWWTPGFLNHQQDVLFWCFFSKSHDPELCRERIFSDCFLFPPSQIMSFRFKMLGNLFTVHNF